MKNSLLYIPLKTAPVYTCFIFIIVFSETVSSQFSSSPYSLFGEGQVEEAGFGVNHSMGGTGIAFKSGYYLNNLNPASYSGIDSFSCLFELGIVGKSTVYQTYNKRQTEFTGNFQYVAMGFRINRWWSTSMGIRPYSHVNYKINLSDQIEGTQTVYQKTFMGEGAINQFYLGNSISVHKDISVGINASYIFGSIKNKESLSILDYYSVEETTVLHSLYFDYGFQYTFYPGKIQYTLGFVYGNKNTLTARNNRQLVQTSDTIDLVVDDKSFIVPARYGVGLSIQNPERFKAGIDYEMRDWTGVDFLNPLLHTRNSSRIAAGIECTPVNIIRKEAGPFRWCYRIGGNYTSTYLVIDDIPINSMAFTVGVGVPIRKGLSRINGSVEWGQYGTMQKGLILEKYWLVHLNVTMHELWFQKSKFD